MSAKLNTNFRSTLLSISEIANIRPRWSSICNLSVSIISIVPPYYSSYAKSIYKTLKCVDSLRKTGTAGSNPFRFVMVESELYIGMNIPLFK